MSSIQEHLDFIEGVIAEEKDKVRKDTNGHTWRHQMAQGMKQAIEYGVHKERLRTMAQLRKARECEVTRLQEHMKETKRRFSMVERIIEHEEDELGIAG